MSSVSLSHREYKRGFTLVELLVVIAIVGFTATVTAARFLTQNNLERTHAGANP